MTEMYTSGQCNHVNVMHIRLYVDCAWGPITSEPESEQIMPLTTGKKKNISTGQSEKRGNWKVGELF